MPGGIKIGDIFKGKVEFFLVTDIQHNTRGVVTECKQFANNKYHGSVMKNGKALYAMTFIKNIFEL